MLKQVFAAILISGFSFSTLATDLPKTFDDLENGKTISVQERFNLDKSGKWSPQRVSKSNEAQREIQQMNMGTANGGGGGGIEVNGQYYTLSQAGLRISTKSNGPFMFGPETTKIALQISEYLESISSFYEKELFRNAIFGDDHIYQPVEVVDPKLYEQLKRQYQKFVAQTPVKGNFKLYAFTSDHTTKLFPDFFKLDPTSQAIVLFHEAIFYLNYWQPLKNVLVFESALTDLLRDPGNPDVVLNYYKSLETVQLINFIQMAHLYIRYVELKGQYLTLADFFGEGKMISDLDRNADGEFLIRREALALDSKNFPDLMSFYGFRNGWVRIYEKYYGCQFEDQHLENFKLHFGNDGNVWIIPINAAIKSNPDPMCGKNPTVRVGFSRH